jgi:hypothetical protein
VAVGARLVIGVVWTHGAHDAVSAAPVVDHVFVVRDAVDLPPDTIEPR